ncbi:MAG TPA: hypothetical protein VN033_06395 [Vulgatibacter sp.]|nr:hypothetical protein [Vulgatibacter sp.]
MTPWPPTLGIRAAALLLLAAVPAVARASPCCAGATVVPGRLMVHEDALVGLDLRVGRELGAFDDGAGFNTASGDELAFEQGIFAALRVAEKGQVAARAPLVQTYRDLRGTREFGGGLGDLQIEARWDFVDAGQYLDLPGIAIVASAALPTGRAPEAVERPLGTDATGTGAFQGMGGVALEHVAGDWLVSATGTVGARAARTVFGEEVPASVIWSAGATVGLMLPRDAVVALAASLTDEPAAERRWLRLGISAGMPLSDEWRLQGGLFGDPPLGGFGRNQPASAGLSFVLIRSWS